MPSLLDILLLGLLAVFAIRGYRRGLVRSLVGIGRLVAAVILTVAVSSPVSQFLDDRLINPPVHDYVAERLTAVAARTEGGVAELYDALPAPLRAHLGESDMLFADMDTAVAHWTDTISRTVSGAVSSVLASVAVFILAWFGLTLGLKLLSGVIHAIPLVATFDRLLGLGAGLLAGVAVVAISARVLSPLLVALGRPEWVDASWLLQMAGK